MQLTEIRIAGFGGQGVILSAIVIGKAASIVDGNHATMTQNFGPEARGGACSAQLVLSDQPVLYPYLTKPDILVVMSQEAYVKFSPELRPGGLMLIEQDLVRVSSMPEGNADLWHSGHPHRRGTRQADGAEHRHDRLLRRRHRRADAGIAAQGH